MRPSIGVVVVDCVMVCSRSGRCQFMQIVLFTWHSTAGVRLERGPRDISVCATVDDLDIPAHKFRKLLQLPLDPATTVQSAMANHLAIEIYYGSSSLISTQQQHSAVNDHHHHVPLLGTGLCLFGLKLSFDTPLLLKMMMIVDRSLVVKCPPLGYLMMVGISGWLDNFCMWVCLLISIETPDRASLAKEQIKCIRINGGPTNQRDRASRFQ